MSLERERFNNRTMSSSTLFFLKKTKKTSSKAGGCARGDRVDRGDMENMGDRGLVTHSVHLKILTIVQEVHTNGWPSGFASLGFLLSVSIIIDNPIRLDYHL